MTEKLGLQAWHVNAPNAPRLVRVLLRRLGSRLWLWLHMWDVDRMQASHSSSFCSLCSLTDYALPLLVCLCPRCSACCLQPPAPPAITPPASVSVCAALLQPLGV
jgi:hypothetical protein